MSVKEKMSKVGSFLDASGVFLKRTAIFVVLLFISLSIIGGLFPSDDDNRRGRDTESEYKRSFSRGTLTVRF